MLIIAYISSLQLINLNLLLHRLKYSQRGGGRRDFEVVGQGGIRAHLALIEAP